MKKIYPCLLLFLSGIIYPASLLGQPAPHIVSQRAQVHSKQVHGSIPGQIPNLLATTSGDVHLDNTRGTYSGIELTDPDAVLENMVCNSHSDVIVLGKLGNGTSSATVDQGYIYTDWDLTVEQVFKNTAENSIQPGETVVVTRPGGELTISGRHVYAQIDRFPRFHAGEEVLLYLRSLPVGTYALSRPDGFFLSRSKVIPIDRIVNPQFASVQRDHFLQLVGNTATIACPTAGAQ